MLFLRLRQSVVPAFILLGVALRPEHFDAELVESLASLGVVLLLFAMGLEFSLGALLRNRRQITPRRGHRPRSPASRPASPPGCCWAPGGRARSSSRGAFYVSSSAIIAKSVIELRRSADPETEVALGILVFEDLFIALYLAVLSGRRARAGAEPRRAPRGGSGKALLFFFGVVLLARRGRPLVERLFATESDDLFLLLAGGLVLLLAWGALAAGLSEAIGAFLAGLALAETSHRERAERLFAPLQGVFAAIFFFAFGLSIDPRTFGEVWLPALLLTVLGVAVKLAGGWLAGRARGLGRRAALALGLVLVPARRVLHRPRGHRPLGRAGPPGRAARAAGARALAHRHRDPALHAAAHPLGLPTARAAAGGAAGPAGPAGSRCGARGVARVTARARPPGGEYAPVVGLEIHVQLRTRSKLFCGDAAEYGASPNTRLCPVCLGLPGALPVPNERAVDLAVRTALGLGCRVHALSRFARKHYSYPDLPKGYQITQHREPLAEGGRLELPGGGRAVRIRRVHLEEDTGKSLHDRVPGRSALDFNRAGVPLVEIVTEPDLRSPAEARAFLLRLKQTLEYLEVSDCNLEEGSLRVDANVSLRRGGEPAGTRTEVKNLNSFSAVEKALAFEVARQTALRRAGGAVEPQTLLWDAGRGEARALRSKEDAADYRYLPEPDLPPLRLDAARVAEQRAALPELPGARAARLSREHALAGAHAEQLCATREMADYFEAVVAAGAGAREAASWLMGEVAAALNREGATPGALGVAPGALAELLGLVAAGELSRTAARAVFAEMRGGAGAREVVERAGLRAVRGEAALAGWVEEALAAHPREVERYRAGERRLLGFFVGRVMRAAGGRADARSVDALLRRRLGG